MGILTSDYSWTRVLSGFFAVTATCALLSAIVMFWAEPEILSYMMWYSGFAATILTLYGAKSLTQKKIIGGENGHSNTGFSK